MIQEMESDVVTVEDKIRVTKLNGSATGKPVHNDRQAPPEGYMTAEEFRKRAIIKVNRFCDCHGISSMT